MNNAKYFLILFCFLANVFAQDCKTESSCKAAYALGLRWGLNASNLYEVYNDGHKSRGSFRNDSYDGWQLGLVLDIAMNDWLYIQPGLMYIQKGTRIDDINLEYAANYIELPLQASLKFSALRINAGPYLGVYLGPEDSGDYCDGPYCYTMAASDFFSTDFGFSMGFGFDIWKFYTGLFYNHGLAGMGNKKHFNYYNRILGFNLGVNFWKI
ncbi:MAG: PorT family protein [Fibromonadaceae bacterium]|jgi:hypothetical protein|nr:PorT family protein [Fibromonadaceae bacterium]